MTYTDEWRVLEINPPLEFDNAYILDSLEAGRQRQLSKISYLHCYVYGDTASGIVRLKMGAAFPILDARIYDSSKITYMYLILLTQQSVETFGVLPETSYFCY